ncbi:MAG: hypothetical protein WAM14_12705 [Candidatus Nitrosopolaris sp.]
MIGMDGTTRATNNDTMPVTHMATTTDKTTTRMIAQGILAGTVVDTVIQYIYPVRDKVMSSDKHNISRRKRIKTNNNSHNPHPRRLVALVAPVIRL